MNIACYGRSQGYPAGFVHTAMAQQVADIPQQMAEALPNAELHLMPRQTHALLFVKPQQVAGLMTDFLMRQLY